MVLMADGRHQPLSKLKQGDWVRCDQQGAVVAMVECVVETKCYNGYANLVVLPSSGLKITPWHPVKLDGKWCFPADVAAPAQIPCPSVFSFVLSTGGTLVLNGIQAVSLAHGLGGAVGEWSSLPDGSDILYHPFFSTHRVLRSLAVCKGWQDGYVQLPPTCVLRDGATGLVCGLTQQEA